MEHNFFPFPWIYLSFCPTYREASRWVLDSMSTVHFGQETGGTVASAPPSSYASKEGVWVLHGKAKSSQILHKHALRNFLSWRSGLNSVGHLLQIRVQVPNMARKKTYYSYKSCSILSWVAWRGKNLKLTKIRIPWMHANHGIVVLRERSHFDFEYDYGEIHLI